MDRHHGSSASDYYFVLTERGARLYYSRVTKGRVARKNIDPKYVDDVLDRDKDPLAHAKRFGGTWYLDDSAGKISTTIPSSYNPNTWTHTFHAFAGRVVSHPHITSIESLYVGNGYMFVSSSKMNTYHIGGVEILMKARRNTQYCAAA